MCAGIDPNERTVKGMMDFLRRGVRTSVALSREESERQGPSDPKPPSAPRRVQEGLAFGGLLFFGALIRRWP